MIYMSLQICRISDLCTKIASLHGCLMLLQAQADVQQLSCVPAVKKFDELSPKHREALFSLSSKKPKTAITAAAVEAPTVKVDHELEIQMKMMAKQWETNTCSQHRK